MRRSMAATFLLTIVVIAAGAWASPPAAPESVQIDVLATLEGEWQGEGELLDRPARFTMSWTKVLDGRYLRLEFSNAFTDVEPVEPVLQSHAYYLLGAPPIAGRWIDSRGVMLSIEAEIADGALIATWSGEENGRTEYRVIDRDTVEVADHVQANGEYYPFATALYRRVR